jgi:uncharacterized protein (TIRG00374 family)
MRRPWITFIGAVFTMGSLYLAFRGTNLDGVLEVLSQVGYEWTLPVLGGTMLSIWIRAYRWKVMLEPVKKISTSKTYSATMIGFMANNVLPMRLGEIVRAYSIGRSAGISKSSAFATIVVERAFDLLAVLLFLGVMLLRYSFTDWVQVAAYVALGICVAMFAVMGLFYWKQEETHRVFRFFIRWLPEELGIKAEGLLSRFLSGLEVLSRGHKLAWITVLSVATWLAMALGFYFSLLAFDLDVPADASIVLVVVCALAVMLPSGPGFIGTFEVGAKYGLMLFKVSDDVALSYALFYHAVQFIPITLLGFYHLWRENFSLRSAVEEEGEL